jgi:adenosylmethionine-8-amino-7-oxononanoate aminotransferase
MTHVFHRFPKVPLQTAVGGDGCYLIDQHGKRYFDGSCGAAVSCLGHSQHEVIAAIHAQSNQLSYAHTSFFTTEPMEKLADHLVSHAPDGLNYVYFVSGGSEAVEAALKMAKQYFLEIGQPQKSCFIARRQSYHGNTIGALSAGGNMWRRIPFEPILIKTTHISPCYEYRDRQPGESLEDYGIRVANELETEILRLGPETVAAFIAEPVVGATMGCVTPVPGYFKRISEICKQYDVLLILDEVMCGMGRTGTMFACEQEGITADLITIAKGLAAGYQPIGALMVSDRIYNGIYNGTGFFQHGHTYLGHTLACATALKVQEIISRDGLLAHVNTVGSLLKQRLEQEFANHPAVGDIRGRGLFIGMELVSNRESKTPFLPERAIQKKVKQIALQEGLMCYPMGGTIDGKLGDHIMLAPPFIMTESDIPFIVNTLKFAIDGAIAS